MARPLQTIPSMKTLHLGQILAISVLGFILSSCGALQSAGGSIDGNTIESTVEGSVVNENDASDIPSVEEFYEAGAVDPGADDALSGDALNNEAGGGALDDPLEEGGDDFEDNVLADADAAAGVDAGNEVAVDDDASSNRSGASAGGNAANGTGEPSQGDADYANPVVDIETGQIDVGAGIANNDPGTPVDGGSACETESATLYATSNTRSRSRMYRLPLSAGIGKGVMLGTVLEKIKLQKTPLAALEMQLKPGAQVVIDSDQSVFSKFAQLTGAQMNLNSAIASTDRDTLALQSALTKYSKVKDVHGIVLVDVTARVLSKNTSDDEDEIPHACPNFPSDDSGTSTKFKPGANWYKDFEAVVRHTFSDGKTKSIKVPVEKDGTFAVILNQGKGVAVSYYIQNRLEPEVAVPSDVITYTLAEKGYTMMVGKAELASAAKMDIEFDTKAYNVKSSYAKVETPPSMKATLKAFKDENGAAVSPEMAKFDGKAAISFVSAVGKTGLATPVIDILVIEKND